MIARLVDACLGNRLLVAFVVAALLVVGVQSFRALPMDAEPDVTSVQVQVLTNAPGLSPLEVEQLVTRPIELTMTGIPGTEVIRSISRPAVSQVTIVFTDDTDLLRAREMVSQRLAAAREAVPEGAMRPTLGPLTSALGEIFHLTVRWPGHTLAELRTLLDWEIALPLRSVPGVVEVNPWGGDVRQIEVRARASALTALGVSTADLVRALQAAGQNVGGGAIERGEEQVLIRVDGQFRAAEDIAGQVVATRPGGLPVFVRDVATVAEGVGFRQSLATTDGRGETVYAMVQMVTGGNAGDVARAVKVRLDEIRARLPAGVVLEPFYDRAAFVDRVLGTVRHSLLEGGLVVVAVLLLLLGDLAAGVVVATTIPLAMLGAFALMRAVGVSGNLMSLGAIDFGLVVDGAVVMVEGALATMATRKISAREALSEESHAVGRPIAFGVMIIGAVYLPILLLEGVEGKMFRPMALTVLFALGMALVLTFTWVPALASMLLRKMHAREPWVVRGVRRLYTPVLDGLLARPWLAAIVAVLLLGVGIVAAIGRGAEFVPRLEEGDLVVQLTRPSSVSLTEAGRGTTEIEQALRKFPEVKRVISRTGSPDVATDVMGLDMSDIFVILAPPREWQTAHTREALVETFDRALRRALPGATFSWTQPIEMRVQELLGGVKSDVGIKLFGDDVATLRRLAEEIAAVTSTVPGSADVRIEPTEGLPMATIRPDPARMGRLGVSPEDVRTAAIALRAGRPVGTLVEGERRFDVVVRDETRPAMEVAALAQHPLVLEGGRLVPLGDVAELRLQAGPAQISRESARRRTLVETNVRGRDLASFVQELQTRLARVPLPPGYFLRLGGQYENLARASARLALVVPATLGAIFVLLLLVFGDWRPATLIFLNVPVAASGGIVALASRGFLFSISAGVGMIALFGVATLNGIVLLSSIPKDPTIPLREAVRRAAHDRLRPVLTTALVASLGFVPMALATGTGAEVQRPLATVVIGGLVTATALTLGVLPSLYLALGKRRR